MQRIRVNLIALLFAASAMLLTPVIYAQTPASAVGGVVPVKVLGDRILLRVALQTETWHKETHIILDFSRRTALEVHGNTRRGLSWGEGEQTMKIVADGFRIEAPRSGLISAREPALDQITAEYDNELEQVDVAAVVGWPVLKDWAIRFNFAEQELTFTPAERATADQAQSWATTIIEGVQAFDDRVLIPLNHNSGQTAWMELDTSSYHTLINQPIAAARGIADAKLDDVFFGSGSEQKLSGVAALWPRNFAQERRQRYEAEYAVEKGIRDQIEEQKQTALEEGREPPEAPAIPPHLLAKPIVEFPGDVLLRSGISLLSAYDLEINPVNGYLALSKQVDSNYSDGDEAFYQATATNTLAALRTYMDAYPDDRNVQDAVSQAFDLGLQQGSDPATLAGFIDNGLNVTQERFRLAYTLGFMRPLFNDKESREQHSQLIIALGEKAMQYIGRAQKPADRQGVQLMLGDRHMAEGDAHTAWKYFLAAAFKGDPNLDGIVRHELGRAYEALGRNRRAYSSYKRALSQFVGLPSEMRENAKQGLERLRSKLDPNDPLLQEEKES